MLPQPKKLSLRRVVFLIVIAIIGSVDIVLGDVDR